MRKRVLIFSLVYFPKHVGGAEVAIKEITDRIDPGEIEFHMITNRFDSTLPQVEQVGNVLVHRIGFAQKNPSMQALKRFPLFLNKPLFQFLAFHYARKLHKKYSYDAVWSMMAHATGVPGGMFKKKYPDVGYVLTLQEGDPPEYIEKKMRPVGPFFKQAFTQADVVQVISRFLGEWAVRMDFPHEPTLIPNGVNIEHFKTACHSIFQGEKTVLTTTSRFVEKNAVDIIIRALSLLPNNVVLHIYGNGPLEDELKKLAKDLGVEERALFKGFASHEVLPEKLKEADVFVRPSRSEGLGVSFLEAMAAGLPVIATNVGGISDFLTHEKTGLFVEVDSPEGVADAVMRLVENSALRTSIIENSRALIEKQYDWNHVAKEMKKDVFDKVLGKS